MSKRNLLPILGLALAAAALVVLVPLLWDGTNSYVDRNDDILRSLPVFPGAREVAKHSHAYYFREHGPADGYSTVGTYEASGVSAEDLLAFYEANLSGEWTVWREETPCISLDTGRACPSQSFLHATRGSAYVSVDPSNLGTPIGSYDVYVDHDSYLAQPTPTAAPGR